MTAESNSSNTETEKLERELQSLRIGMNNGVLSVDQRLNSVKIEYISIPHPLPSPSMSSLFPSPSAPLFHNGLLKLRNTTDTTSSSTLPTTSTKTSMGKLRARSTTSSSSRCMSKEAWPNSRRYLRTRREMQLKWMLILSRSHLFFFFIPFHKSKCYGLCSKVAVCLA